MRAADHLVDFGPGPGVKGGEVVAEGTIADLAAAPDEPHRPVPLGPAGDRGSRRTRKPPTDRRLTIVGARQNNLKDIDVTIPLGLFVCVTGVSGSGKSSLVGDILRDALARDLNGAITEPGLHDRIEGLDQLDKVIDIDQSPIGRTPRSNPATYIKLFDLIRDLYTRLPEAKARGYKAGRFSFNVAGGRCEACEGNGSNRLEMDFLADVWVTCPVCEGKRFNRETLHARFKGKSISDVLEMDVQEALEHFANVPKIAGDAPDPARRRARLPEARPALADALRRRGAADQAGPRAGQAGHGQDALHPRRADHRPPLRRRPQAARSPPRLHRAGQHGGRDRAQPRRGQDRRLGDRPRPRGGRRRRPDRRRGDARAGRRGRRAATPAQALQRVLAGRRPPTRNGKAKKAAKKRRASRRRRGWRRSPSAGRGSTTSRGSTSTSPGTR